MRLPLVRLIERTLNLKPNQWVRHGWFHPLGLQTYEITSFGALGAPKPMKMQHSAPFGAASLREMQHAAPMGLSLGLQTLWEYNMRRPWVLPFLTTVAFSSEFRWRGGANPTPSRSPSSRSKRARCSTCTPAGACAIRVHAGAAQCQCCSCHLRAS